MILQSQFATYKIYFFFAEILTKYIKPWGLFLLNIESISLLQTFFLFFGSLSSQVNRPAFMAWLPLFFFIFFFFWGLIPVRLRSAWAFNTTKFCEIISSLIRMNLLHAINVVKVWKYLFKVDYTILSRDYIISMHYYYYLEKQLGCIWQQTEEKYKLHHSTFSMVHSNRFEEY